ncbi:uncharacterized protein LOC128594759 [Nycticebus coucang]|uniref:uncharacterized protein LOC128594759 n=1 Tax=Nycticebus coucang TaxID=9470 RepID=UPI00234E29B2|nr:uncharacterized protein LOC128594759 [Nycticebus coucang]
MPKAGVCGCLALQEDGNCLSASLLEELWHTPEGTLSVKTQAKGGGRKTRFLVEGPAEIPKVPSFIQSINKTCPPKCGLLGCSQKPSPHSETFWGVQGWRGLQQPKAWARDLLALPLLESERHRAPSGTGRGQQRGIAAHPWADPLHLTQPTRLFSPPPGNSFPNRVRWYRDSDKVRVGTWRSNTGTLKASGTQVQRGEWSGGGSGFSRRRPGRNPGPPWTPALQPPAFGGASLGPELRVSFYARPPEGRRPGRVPASLCHVPVRVHPDPGPGPGSLPAGPRPAHGLEVLCSREPACGSLGPPGHYPPRGAHSGALEAIDADAKPEVLRAQGPPCPGCKIQQRPAGQVCALRKPLLCGPEDNLIPRGPVLETQGFLHHFKSSMGQRPAGLSGGALGVISVFRGIRLIGGCWEHIISVSSEQWIPSSPQLYQRS